MIWRDGSTRFEVIQPVLAFFKRAANFAAQMAIHVGWSPKILPDESLLDPRRIVFVYAITMVVGGFVAGAVAKEIRTQVEAALKEAETKLQVERLLDKNLNEAGLMTLGDRLKLANGWRYQTRTPDEDLVIENAGGKAYAIQDDFKNTYQRKP